MNGNVKFHDRGIFVIFDKVAEAWIGQPLIEKHPAAAARLFSQLLGDKNTSLSSHPKDYNLVHIGFIKDDGTVEPVERNIVLSGEAWVAMHSQDVTPPLSVM